MRAMAMCTLAAAAMAGCLRSTEFRCLQDADCGAAGACEATGFCSIPNADCTGTGRAYSDSAGHGLSGSCVPAGQPGPGSDAGVDGMIDGGRAGCPSGYATAGGSAHLYKLLVNVTWDEAKIACDRTTTAAYLAVPDDATELANLATVAAATPFWVGIDDKDSEGTFVTQKGVPVTFKPWAPGEPDDSMGGQDCVAAIAGGQIETDKCGTRFAAVCECEPGS